MLTSAPGPPVVLNDVHSRLNPTRVAEVVRPGTIDALCAAVRRATSESRPVSIAGGRHAMGGQQFATDALHLDTTTLDRVLGFDPGRGLIEAEAGITWPALVRATHALQPGPEKRWGIRQKQTGADDMTLGGSVSANVHGRGLLMPPIADDVEALSLVTRAAEVVRCSRDERPELFSLVVGGYGLFGAIATVTLRLGPRRKLRRIVDVVDLDDAAGAVYRRVEGGCLYGDFQFAIDPTDDDAFLRRGVFACYKPAAASEPVDDGSADLTPAQWLELLRLAHVDKPRAFRLYSQHYLATHGRAYWSDTMQLGTYLPGYAEHLARTALSDTARDGDGVGVGRPPDESLVIGELYVPPPRLVDFMAAARGVLRAAGTEVIYGTIRAIRRDTTSFLPWARDDYACVVLNLRTPHTPAGLARTERAFRDLHDAAIGLGGSFYLTYHRNATRAQVAAAHPRFAEFLHLKRRYDPDERFQSEWYRHYRRLFRGAT